MWMLSERDGQEAKGSAWARLCHENGLYVGRVHDECRGNVGDRRSNRCADTISMLADVEICQSHRRQSSHKMRISPAERLQCREECDCPDAKGTYVCQGCDSYRNPSMLHCQANILDKAILDLLFFRDVLEAPHDNKHVIYSNAEA